ncbi:hypothetical protein CORC01_01683 [Colletotrichum orchidophilum]|uniref:Uncharacterized protein n=1 Tax=Colletotrichum orchidophilum TaxID=1209926 RepID=A0A1G4BNM6_9PEZI|nr:uncharacterized protein CORC01_01683 [Colletotrichum orchidophilum]OHF02925.1 hypothetical protein CORC01_01683 [Colletotrichum orchidophilum]
MDDYNHKIQHESIYDEKWWVENCREDPDPRGLTTSPPTSPSPSPGDADIQQDSSITIPQHAIHTHDKTAESITALRPPGHPHAPLFLGVPPVKLANKGEWSFIEYIPPWTDPQWQHDNHRIPDRDYPSQVIRPHLWTTTLRPAQLPQDRAQNPTALALRFGIYPDRLDGRSRLTPTRGGFRRFRVDGVVQPGITGEYVIAKAEELAARARLGGVDALLEAYSKLGADERQPSDRERYVLRAMQDMRDDEDWQSIMFRGLTTHELLEEGMMSFKSEHGCDLQNPLHCYLQRDKWAEQTWRGADPQCPRLVYHSGNFKGEWDPRTNDGLWAKMQPALILASRMLTHLETHDPYWQCLHDALNRLRIKGPRDYRTPAMKKRNPAVEFSLRDPDPDPDDGEGEGEGDDPTTNIADPQTRRAMAADVMDETLHVLRTKMRFMLCSGVRDSPCPEGGRPQVGFTHVQGGRIEVNLAADVMWPLVVAGYSNDERILTYFTLATTIVHEIAHAINYAHHLVLYPPEYAGCEVANWESHPDKVEKALKIGKCMFGQLKDHNIEPFFENEPQSELGFCTENRLFGGVNWGLISLETETDQLYFLPSAMMMERWPQAYGPEDLPTLQALKDNPENLILSRPRMLTDQYCIPTKVADIARLFTESFWAAEVLKYGPAALHFGSADPVKIPPITSTYIDFNDSLKGVLDPRSHKVSELYPEEDDLKHAGALVYLFVREAAVEFLRYHIARFRWGRDQANYETSRYPEMMVCSMQIWVVMSETKIAVELGRGIESVSNGRASQAWLEMWKRAEIRKHRAPIDKLTTAKPSLLCNFPFRLPLGSVHPQDEVAFWKSIPVLRAQAGQRLAALLRRLYEMVLFEVGCFQHLYLDIYRLEPAEIENFKTITENLGARLENVQTLCDLVASRIADCLAADDGSMPAISVAALRELETKFLHTSAQVQEMTPWAADISRIVPANFNLLQQFLPTLKTARRPKTARMVKIVQKELGLVPVEVLEGIQTFLDFVKTRAKALIDVRIDMARDGMMDLDEVITEFEKRDKFAAPGLVEDGTDDENEDGLGLRFDNDPLAEIIRKRKERADIWNPTRHPPKRARIVTPQLVPRPLRHPRPFSTYSPPRLHRSQHHHHHQFGHASTAGFYKGESSILVGDPRFQIPNVFADIPQVTFPLKESLPRPAISQLGQKQPQPPTYSSVFGMPAVRIEEGPEPVSIFPHPYALAATFTEDLEHEANFRLQLAKKSPAGSVLGFTERNGAGIMNAYRDPEPAIPDSPEESRRPVGGFGFGGWQRGLPDPQDWSPDTESLSDLPPSTPDTEDAGPQRKTTYMTTTTTPGAVAMSSPALVEDGMDGYRWEVLDQKRLNPLYLQQQRAMQRRAHELVEEQKRRRQQWLESLARPVIPAGMEATGLRPVDNGRFSRDASTKFGSWCDGDGPRSAKIGQKNMNHRRRLSGNMEWEPTRVGDGPSDIQMEFS